MAKNDQKWPKITKNDFFAHQSVYTQNDRNFALVMNLSVVFFQKKVTKHFKKIEIFFQIFLKKHFPGVFNWFCLHKKVSLTTLGPSGRLGGVRIDPRRPQVGPQRAKMAKNGQNWPKITKK